MNGAIITHPGLEAVSGKEVKELIGVDAEIKRSVVLFTPEKMEDLCTLCYRSQSAVKVLCVLFTSRFRRMEDILPKIERIDLSGWLEGKTFCVRSRIVENEGVDTMESERLIGEVIHEKFKAKVDLEKPDIPLFAYFIGNDFYFGVDFAGFDMSKRNYRIFSLSDSVKATVSYALVRLGGYKKGMTLLDPFVQSGTVAIEAAFFATKKPINFYNKDRFAFFKFPQLKEFSFEKFFEKQDRFDADVRGITASDSQQRHVKAAEKNAKVAGVNKIINFTRFDVEWIDTKFEKQSVDRIISNPPKVSRLLTEKGIEKLFQELFYTADFILKKDGRIVLLAKNYKQILNHAGRHNFALKANFPFMQGKEEFSVLVFEREKK
ncbi:methyltransferase [Candidatus Woesearchaeota archaeon]|nr:methyltransferase [Candidatus Woesearchaeota archaeon]